ncbi:MAG: hypothetical protein ABSB29_06460 [Nitrososphaerales archaeon]|jgi:tetratricopeptide (TPR) repeat protein
MNEPDRTNEPIRRFDRTHAIWAKYWSTFNTRRRALAGGDLQTYEDRFARLYSFFWRNLNDQGFHRHLNRLTDYVGHNNAPVIREHLVILTKYVLLDSLKAEEKEYATIKDLKGRSDPSRTVRQTKYAAGIPGYKQLHRFVSERYPELIDYPIRLLRLPPADLREQIFQTTFTEPEISRYELGFAELMQWYLEGMPRQLALFLDQRMERNQILRILDPIDLGKLIVYRKDVLAAIEHEFPLNLVQKYGANWMLLQFEKYGYGVQALLHQLRWYVECKWFEWKDDATQRTVIAGGTDLPYYPNEARIGVKRNLEWFGDPNLTFRSASATASVLLKMKRNNEALEIYKECLKLRLSRESRGFCWGNIAHCYYWSGNVRKSLNAFNRAAGIWKREKNPREEAVVQNRLALIYRSIGDMTRYKEHRELTTNLLKMPMKVSKPEWMAKLYIDLADFADHFEDREWERELVAKGFEISQKCEDLQYPLYLGQWVTDLRDYGRCLPDGPGRMPHPNMEDWEQVRISDTFGETFR